MARPSPSSRQGALPLHLTLALLPWLASKTALQISRGGSNGLNTANFGGANPLAGAWTALLANPRLAKAVEAEARNQAVEFLAALQRYQKTPFDRNVAEPPVAWAQSAARLLDYGGGKRHAPVVVLVPSLINRYYLLDLTEKLSFARYLGREGMRVLILDWGAPSVRERDYDCARYVTDILMPVLQWVRRETEGPVVLGGYCMGGLLTLALAQLRPGLVDAAAFFATPWDFSAAGFARMRLEEKSLARMEAYLNASDHVSADAIHTLFHCMSPYAFPAKLRAFGRMQPEQPATQEFLAIEHWVNDGVPMTRGAAKNCFIGWAYRNEPMRRQWKVDGRIMDPAHLKIPSFVAVPRGDRIVPAECALPLAERLRDATVVQPQSGHIGMLVGSRRKSALWEPFSEWICSLFT